MSYDWILSSTGSCVEALIILVSLAVLRHYCSALENQPWGTAEALPRVLFRAHAPEEQRHQDHQPKGPKGVEERFLRVGTSSGVAVLQFVRIKGRPAEVRNLSGPGPLKITG